VLQQFSGITLKSIIIISWKLTVKPIRLQQSWQFNLFARAIRENPS